MQLALRTHYHGVHREKFFLVNLFCLCEINKFFHVVAKCDLVHNVESTFEPCHEKTNILVANLVRHKPGCTSTEDG